MRWITMVAAATFFAACKPSGPAPSDGAQPTAGVPGVESERASGSCGNITTLADVMHCEVAPYMSRGEGGDEAAFRRTLQQLRELAPSDPAFVSGPQGWPQIVDTMLATRNYRQGCAACHRQYLKAYRASFSDVTVPWSDVHSQAAK